MTFFGHVVFGAVGNTVSSGVKGFFTFQSSFCFEYFCEIDFFENISLFDCAFDFEMDRGLKIVPSALAIKIDETFREESFWID